MAKSSKHEATETKGEFFVTVTQYKCVKCGTITDTKPDACKNPNCPLNIQPPKTLEQKRAEEKELIKKHDLARIESRLRRQEITKDEAEQAIKAIQVRK